MAPSNPKRPPRPPRPPGAPASKAKAKDEVELPFDDDEVAPLQEDDPRPQRVPQFPAGPRRIARGTSPGRDDKRDRELSTRFDANEYSDPGYEPVFLYVERGPGVGQLIPVKQGPLVIGRASACDLRLQHPSISRRHAQLMRQSERFLLRDLGSQNGTFVNRVKLSGDTEIRVGDEIALGNAVLKLRKQGTPSSDKVPQASLPRGRASRMGMSITRVALVAAAVGSAVAALLTLAVLRFTDSGTEEASGGTSPSTDEKYTPPPPPTEEERAAARQEESARAAKPLGPRAENNSGPRASEPRAAATGVKASTLSKRESGSRASAQGTKSSGGAEQADILARYEKGEVAAALSLARAAKLEPLASRIADFQSAQDAAKKALATKDHASAIQHLNTALVVDQELSQGWSIQGRKIRKQLGHLHTLTGLAQKVSAPASARVSFEMALKYDPSNVRAKTELQQLGGK
ncbi:MAG TPA: FHA domain-containing protein [Myxococcaceae bacterium]